VEYAGIFTLFHVPAEYTNLFLFVEAPRILFPFARSIIAHLTQESGTMPLLRKRMETAAEGGDQAEKNPDPTP